MAILYFGTSRGLGPLELDFLEPELAEPAPGTEPAKPERESPVTEPNRTEPEPSCSLVVHWMGLLNFNPVVGLNCSLVTRTHPRVPIYESIDPPLDEVLARIVEADVDLGVCVVGRLHAWQSPYLAVSIIGSLHTWHLPYLAVSMLGSLHTRQSPYLAVSVLAIPLCTTLPLLGRSTLASHTWQIHTCFPYLADPYLLPILGRSLSRSSSAMRMHRMIC